MDTTPTAGTVAKATTFTSEPEVEQQTVKPVAVPRARRKSNTATYDRIGYTLALIGAVSVAGIVWYVGAYYTLRGLTAFGVQVNGPAWWLLPTFITAIELWLMPKRGVGWQSILMFLAILGFDVLTSWFGLRADLAGRPLPLGAGWTLPASGLLFHVGCIALSLGFAFLPEKIGRWASRELWGTWA